MNKQAAVTQKADPDHDPVLTLVVNRVELFAAVLEVWSCAGPIPFHEPGLVFPPEGGNAEIIRGNGRLLDGYLECSPDELFPEWVITGINGWDEEGCEWHDDDDDCDCAVEAAYLFLNDGLLEQAEVVVGHDSQICEDIFVRVRIVPVGDF